ncbi:MAG: hypothetical protein AB1414_11200 [bacterium]
MSDRYLSKPRLIPDVERILLYLIILKDITKEKKEEIQIEKKEEIQIKLDNEVMRISDPFNVPLWVANKLEPEDVKLLFHWVEKKYTNLIEEGFQDKKIGLIVLCNHKIVATSDDPDGLMDEEITSFAEKEGKIPYVITRSRLIEEIKTSDWNQVNNDDWYPTIPLYLKSKNAVKKDIRIEADFDTGNPVGGCLAFPDEFRRSLGEPGGITRKEIRFGREYEFFLKDIKIGIRDGEMERVEDFKVRFVIDSDWIWAFQIGFNPKRKGFVGRNILFKSFFCVTLNPKTRTSMLKLL